jgi:inward rectifier potassium channel
MKNYKKIKKKMLSDSFPLVRGSRSRSSIAQEVIVLDKRTIHLWQDLYYYSLAVCWPIFFCAIAIVFILLNVLFAFLFMLGTAPIANQYPADFLGAFFFSIETIATVGYGDMHPQTTYAHIVASIPKIIRVACRRQALEAPGA